MGTFGKGQSTSRLGVLPEELKRPVTPTHPDPLISGEGNCGYGPWSTTQL